MRSPGASTYINAAGWWYPKATDVTTVSLPQYGYADEDAPDGVNNQGNTPGQWFWCDCRTDTR